MGYNNNEPAIHGRDCRQVLYHMQQKDIVSVTKILVMWDTTICGLSRVSSPCNNFSCCHSSLEWNKLPSQLTEWWSIHINITTWSSTTWLQNWERVSSRQVANCNLVNVISSHCKFGLVTLAANSYCVAYEWVSLQLACQLLFSSIL